MTATGCLVLVLLFSGDHVSRVLPFVCCLSTIQLKDEGLEKGPEFRGQGGRGDCMLFHHYVCTPP